MFLNRFSKKLFLVQTPRYTDIPLHCLEYALAKLQRVPSSMNCYATDWYTIHLQSYRWTHNGEERGSDHASEVMRSEISSWAKYRSRAIRNCPQAEFLGDPWAKSRHFYRNSTFWARASTGGTARREGEGGGKSRWPVYSTR